MLRVQAVADRVKRECSTLGHVEDWFYNHHLLKVAVLAIGLRRYFPESDEEVLMLSVWLHDIGRIRGLEGEHAKAGADEARKILEEFGYDEEIIEQVHHNILTHGCKKGNLPTSLEGKMLASADAMSHFYEDFYLRIFVNGTRTVEEFKVWALEKIERDFNDKLFFEVAKDTVRRRYIAWRDLLTIDERD